ncbi:uncharacterized protein H6S33_007483 [Morchella sextelata]|uniref:uncharacterized protein n=1 Tax=Morchella sextelata TaxID=1174677 RepID=UPI001D057B33|nr:uncharacterized protein H6S33_007483 [Morchella sextelata]KAH0603824.1 hypothetical protein H6S33_007483 [Morchella sextelata]
MVRHARPLPPLAQQPDSHQTATRTYPEGRAGRGVETDSWDITTERWKLFYNFLLEAMVLQINLCSPLLASSPSAVNKQTHEQWPACSQTMFSSAFKLEWQSYLMLGIVLGT